MTEAKQQVPVDGAPQAATPSAAAPDIKPITPPPEPEYELLDPARLTLFWDGTGHLRATVEEDRSFLDVNVVRCFPQSIPDRFWALSDRSARVIGVIPDPKQLDKESLTAAQNALARQYFAPVITVIRSLKEEFGAVYFEVETDRGPRSFVAKGVRDGIEQTDTGELMISDVDENRYRIPDWHTLDARSRRLVERII